LRSNPKGQTLTDKGVSITWALEEMAMKFMAKTWIRFMNYYRYRSVCREVLKTLMEGKKQVDITFHFPTEKHTITFTPSANGRRAENHYFTFGENFSESHTHTMVRRG
jgi:hypothetical protein